jgi:hypothetical protein
MNDWQKLLAELRRAGKNDGEIDAVRRVIEEGGGWTPAIGRLHVASNHGVIAGSINGPVAVGAGSRAVQGASGSSDAADGPAPERTGDKEGTVFLGHGHSSAWQELKQYIEGPLGLRAEEFNGEPMAGRSTIERLAQMLSRSSFAFLVLTGEDLAANGKLHPRANVIHEVGLFQGRLGFARAVVVLEEGCEEFSNIHGLGHIAFRKDYIRGAFVEVRRVLWREGLVSN